MAKKFMITIFLLFCGLIISNATNPSQVKPTTFTCPLPSPEVLRCLRQWSCQHAIRLDLRCLLNLNGTPLLGGLLGGNNGGGLLGGNGGGGLLGGVGGGNGIVGGLLGR